MKNRGWYSSVELTKEEKFVARGVSLARRQHPFRSPFDATAVDDRNVGSRGFRWGRSRFHGPARGIFVDSRS